MEWVMWNSLPLPGARLCSITHMTQTGKFVLVSHQKPLTIYRKITGQYLTSGNHGPPQVCGHSIRTRSSWDDSCRFCLMGHDDVRERTLVHEEILLGHDKYLCIRGYVGHRRVDTQQAQERVDTTKRGEICSCPWQPRPQEGYPVIRTAESLMGLSDTNQWTGPTHKLTRCWRCRWWWHWFWLQDYTRRPTLIEWVVRLL